MEPAENPVVEEPDVEEPAAAPAEQPDVKDDGEGGVVVRMPEEGQRQPRKARREDFRRQREGQELDLKRYREEADSLRARVIQMEAQLQERLRQPPAQQPSARDAYKEQVARIRTQQETIQAALRSGTVTDAAEVDRLRNQYYQLNDQAEELRDSRVKREAVEEFQRAQPNRQGEYEEAALRNEFPEVLGHPQAMRWAIGFYHQLVAEGKPPTLTTSREAMTKAAERYQLRTAPVPPPSASQRAKFGGVPAQAGTKTSSNEIKLDAGQKRMAIARWPRDDEHVAYAKMAVLVRKIQDADKDDD